jgi:hypothetical protein
MSKPQSQNRRALEILKENPNQKFTASEIAELLIRKHPDVYKQKLERSEKINSHSQLVNQMAAELSGLKRDKNVNTHIECQLKPSPQRYWYSTKEKSFDGYQNEKNTNSKKQQDGFSEQDMYSPFRKYLGECEQLESFRIDERRSKNSKGGGGNQWLHPDIVAMKKLDINMETCVRGCIDERVQLLSYEVKTHISLSNVRNCFFQAVSNSSWANEGYLVTSSIADQAMEELKMLSARHGIGVIVGNMVEQENGYIYDGDVLIPAKFNNNVDWNFVNRLVVENIDFTKFIKRVYAYKDSWKHGNLLLT